MTILLALITKPFAQAFVANVETVYGGRISAMASGSLSLPDSFRVVVATESANSIFYADGKFSLLGATNIGKFTVLPAANSTAGYGSNIQQIAYHPQSKLIFFVANGNIYSASTSAASATTIISTGNVVAILIESNKLYYMTRTGADNTYYIGNLDASGIYTASSNATITGQSYTKLVAGKNNQLYTFREGTDPQLATFSGTFSTSVTLTSVTTDAQVSLVNTIYWSAAGIYTDGTIFVGGSDNNGKKIANATSLGTAYTIINTGIVGTHGPNIDFYTGLFGNYHVYFASIYSNNKGTIGSWNNFGNTSFETHPNDGTVHAVANVIAGGAVMMTTDQGLGLTKNSGSVITEINNGIEAVQVNDFDMNATKTHGWLASKAGVRLVSNYNTSSQNWSNAMFPNRDGSPYYSAEMIGNNTDQAYVGNVRLYKTTNSGTTWTRVFTAENAPYNFNSSAVVEAIEVSKDNNNIVMAGYSQEGTNSGGCFYSLDGGVSWSQLLIKATSTGQDIDVNDIVFTKESGKIVAYIGVEYTTTHNGVYRAEFDGTSTWTLSQNTTLANSGDGISLPFNVKDLDASPTGDTLIFVGTSGTAGSGNGFFKIISSDNKWYKINVNSSSLSLTNINAGAIGLDTLFLSQDNKIAYAKITKATMTLHDYSTLPVGTQSTCLYYDALVGGGSTGFYAFRGNNPLPTVAISPVANVALCSGSSALLSTNTTGSGLSYKWYKDGTEITGATASSYAVTQAGSYLVIVTNSNGSASSNEVNITVNPLPTAMATAATATSFCTGSTVTLNANTATGFTYQWLKDGANITGATSAIYSANSSGSYTVGVTNASTGCVASSSAIAVTVHSLPVASISATTATTFCAGGSVILNASTGSGLTYQWLKDASNITGATASSYTANSSGNYSVRITNANSCINTSATTIVNAITVATPSIVQITDTLISNTTAGNQWYLNGSAITGAVSQKYKVLNSGQYYTKITDGIGCQSTNSNTINVVLTALTTVTANNKDWSVSPNPIINSQLRIIRKGVSANEKFRAQIVNQLGNICGDKLLNSGEIWQVHSLLPGNYIVRIIEKQQWVSIHFIKQ